MRGCVRPAGNPYFDSTWLMPLYVLCSHCKVCIEAIEHMKVNSIAAAAAFPYASALFELRQAKGVSC